MYRIAVYDNDPPTAEQSRSAACHVLNGKGRLQGQRFCLCHFSYLANLALVGKADGLQNRHHRGADMDELHHGALRIRRFLADEQRAQTGAADVRHLGKIEHKAGRALERVQNGALQLRAGVRIDTPVNLKQCFIVLYRG